MTGGSQLETRPGGLQIKLQLQPERPNQNGLRESTLSEEGTKGTVPLIVSGARSQDLLSSKRLSTVR